MDEAIEALEKGREGEEKVEASYCGWPWISPYTRIS
jgi:hypothetical protein